MPAPWHIYEDELRWPISSSGIFLAQAVQIIGNAASVTWSDEMPTWMRINPPEWLPLYEDAFDDDENAIPSVHAQFRDVARAAIAPSTYGASCLSDAGWIRDFVSILYRDELTQKIFLQTEDQQSHQIDEEIWEEVGLLSAHLRSASGGAKKQTRYVAKLLQSLVLESKVTCYVRPVGGSLGGTLELPLKYWEVDDPLPRIAWCGIDMDEPLNPAAEPTHWIFVNRPQLDEALKEVHAHLLIDDRPLDFEYMHSRSVDMSKYRDDRGNKDRIINDLYHYLINAFETHSLDVKKDYFLSHAPDKTGWRISRGNWETAWNLATQEHLERRKPGRPPKK